MAENKKSFILYTDITHTVELLSDEEKGKLFQFILDYVNDKDPITKDIAVKLAFEPIKQQFKRDLIKWEQTRGKRSEAGKASAEARKLLKEKEAQQTSTNPTSVKSVEQNPTNPTVSVNANVTVTVNDNVINEDKETIFNIWISYRKEIKKPVKAESTLNTLIERFNSEPLEKCKWIVNHSIEGGYQGLFWDKYNNKSNTTKNEELSKITTAIRESNPNK